MPVQISVCLMAWIFTLVRLRALRWKDIHKDYGVALYVWLALLFFSLGLTFLIKDFGDFLDRHTLNNLSKLITYCSLLSSISLGTVAFITAVSKASSKRLIRWVGLLFLVTITIMIVIYSLFISKLPPINYHVARSFPEASFRFVMYFFSLVLLILHYKVFMTYLPSEKSPLMYMRIVAFIVSTIFSAMYFVVMIIMVVGGYFWPFLGSQILIDLSSVLFVVSAFLVLFSLSSNKIYLRFIVMSKSLANWQAFKDLDYLMKRLLVLCPVVALPTNNPSFLRFLSNPEFYLYRAIVIILDGSTMLADFLSETAHPGEPALWEANLLEEAVRVNQVLQSVQQSENFWEIVNEYKRASRELFHDRDANYALER
jgi:hypothetical protein